MGMENMGISPFEAYMMSHKESKKPSGTAIAGITVASVAAAAAVGAWIFGGVYTANVNKNSQRAIDLLAASQLRERDERVSQQTITNKTVLDIATGAYANASAASTAAALAYQNGGLYGGSYNGLPTGGTVPVSLWQAPQPCCCPNPCGCVG